WPGHRRDILMARMLAALLALAALPGCEQALGVDFAAYAEGCSPVGTPTCPAGTACLFNSAEARFRCAVPAGTVSEDSQCEQESDCSPGFACSIFENNTSSHCTRYCAVTQDCQPGRQCFEFKVKRRVVGGTTVGACGPLKPPCNPLDSPS